MPEDLSFSIDASWTGTGREGRGTIRSGGLEIAYSAPASMGGQGSGTSPEELLMAAVTACYSGTLFRVLQQRATRYPQPGRGPCSACYGCAFRFV